MSAGCWRDSVGTRVGAEDSEGEFAGVEGISRRRGRLGADFGVKGGVSAETCAEMPLSRMSLARPLEGIGACRGGKESPKLSRQGVTGVLGPVLMELGVLAKMDDCELEKHKRHKNEFLQLRCFGHVERRDAEVEAT